MVYGLTTETKGWSNLNKLKLLTMSNIPAEEVRWLWYPYLPKGKITIVQGDPGEGKTTFVLALAALLTRGLSMPGGADSQPPMSVIYQTAEDGLADTVKPRLTALGADCSRVLVIDESERELTLSDQRLAQAIRETGAGLLVLDPIQAYLGAGVDMHRANEVRPIFKRLGQLAEQTGCAIVLVGHMNKMQGARSAYRGLGSIDFRAAARSVLLVGRSKDDSDVRVVVHDKSSLAPEGASILFSLHSDTGFSWNGFCDTTARAAFFSSQAIPAPAFAGVAFDSGGTAGLAGAVVRLGRALERTAGTAPVSDSTTAPHHGDRKTLSREREKKIALGHKEDDHEEEQTWQQTM